MTGSAATDQNARPPRTPETHYKWQSADAQGANQALEILDKVRTSNMIFRGQKQLHRLVELKNRFLFGKEAVDEVTLPEDDVRINCPEIHNHYTAPEAKPADVAVEKSAGAAAVVPSVVAPASPASPATAKPSILPSLLKIGLGAVMAGTGVGLPFALPSIISGVGGLFSRAEPAQQPATGSGNPAVIINGEAYELSLEGGEKDEE